MINDAQLEYARAQTLSASGASTNKLDHGSDRNIGIGEGMVVFIHVTAIDAASGNETYSVALRSDADDSMGSPTTVCSLLMMNIGVPLTRVLAAKMTSARMTLATRSSATHVS